MSDRSVLDRLTGPRAAVTVVFIVHGMLFASWTAHIPHVESALGLNDGSLGLALLGAPIGSITATAATGWLLPRWGSRRVVQVALVGYCAAGPFTGLAGNVGALFAALFAWGMFQGCLDVSMNTQGIAVERAGTRVLMPGLHGAWSIGSFAGAGIGALAVGAGISLTPQLLVAGTVALFAGGVLTTRMLPDAREPHDATAGERAPRTRVPGVVLVLGAIAAAGMLCEGATADWASVYLSGTVHARGIAIGTGYAVFSLGMVAVRLSGSRVFARYPARQVLPVLATLATVGVGLGLAVPSLATALIGFVLLGLGLGAIVPTIFSAAGELPGLHAGTAVATVSGLGWLGFVCGPPLIGFLANATTLRAALVVLPVLTAVLALSTARVAALRGEPAAVSTEQFPDV